MSLIMGQRLVMLDASELAGGCMCLPVTGGNIGSKTGELERASKLRYLVALIVTVVPCCRL